MCDDEFYPITAEDLYPGTAFYWKESTLDRSHLFFILTEPDEIEKVLVVVAVNLTGKTDRGLGSDTTVTLNVGDHPFITKPSVIVYRKATFFKVENLLRYINEERSLETYELEDELFQKIQRGLLESDQTPIRIQNYCQSKFNFD
jgi:hypothetical protein